MLEMRKRCPANNSAGNGVAVSCAAGLLPPAARNAANYRVYEATHVQRVLEKELRRLRKQCSSSEAAADCDILTGLERAAGLPVAAVSAAPTTCGAGVLGLGTHRTTGRKDSAP